ncbi:MAG: hypothetical protein M3H12_00395, partial [Chromatiales bacterium]
VESYVYLGQRYSIRDKNQDNEIQRRITAGWTAFAKHRDIFKGNSGTCLKRQVYNSCVLPTMTYGAETWALTNQAKKQASSRTIKDGKKYVIHHIPGRKNKRLGKREDNGHRRNGTSQNKEVDLGRTHQ